MASSLPQFMDLPTEIRLLVWSLTMPPLYNPA